MLVTIGNRGINIANITDCYWDAEKGEIEIVLVAFSPEAESLINLAKEDAFAFWKWWKANSCHIGGKNGSTE